LLDISRLEAGRLSLECKATNMAALVRDLVVQTQTSTRSHTITLNAPATVEAIIDPLRIEQVLSNLLDNAIKYSPEGGPIEVDLAVTDQIQLCVTDHGIGIPPEHRAHIFDRFYQANRSSSIAGMGLGLYISHQIVELHGGTLEAEFPDAGGTRIIMTLPRAPASK